MELSGECKKILVMPTVNDGSATREEMDRGTVLSEHGALDIRLSGGRFKTRSIDVSDGSSVIPKAISGRVQALGGPLVMEVRGDTGPVRDALVEGTVFSMVVMPSGDVVGRPMETWTLKVVKQGPLPTLGNEARGWGVRFETLGHTAGVVPASTRR